MSKRKVPKGFESEFIGMMLGSKLGQGISRRTYVLRSDESRVVKVEYSNGNFQNTAEWMIWDIVQSTPMAKWFAPCFAISHSGNFLVQARTQPLLVFPKKIPAFFSDIQKANWGSYEGRPVAHDYGLNLSIDKALAMSSLVKADFD